MVISFSVNMACCFYIDDHQYSNFRENQSLTYTYKYL